MNFNELLRYIMDTEGYKIDDICVKSGVSVATLTLYLNGERQPTLRVARNIIDSLGYDIGIFKKKCKKRGVDLNHNGSGCYDPVAGRAIRKADAERERLTKLLDTIFTICDYAGFHVEGRIELKDKRTGKIWK